MSLYLGCPLWSYKPWLGSFYPEGTKQSQFLREYAHRLTTVEGNTTFYAVPNEEILARWAAEMPETFRFCPKLPRTISHAGELQPHIQEAHAFIQVMRQLGPRLGPMFLQLPPRYAPNLLEDLGAFLKAWPALVPLAVEVRHPAWFTSPHQEHLLGLLEGLGKAQVLIDTRPIRSLSGNKILAGSVYQQMLVTRDPQADRPISTSQEGGFIFLRFIGHPLLEQNDAFIEEWAEHLAGALAQGREAYVFCHCPDERLDPWLCREFHQRVNARFTLPSLPWDEIDAHLARQSRLL
ncbi:MAG: DUF72 domain-containing protein [Chloroflexi bacterium]|nr:MAG: DUF72 domain-containing protein [Chloroflexota bacterium]